MLQIIKKIAIKTNLNLAKIFHFIAKWTAVKANFREALIFTIPIKRENLNIYMGRAVTSQTYDGKPVPVLGLDAYAW